MRRVWLALAAAVGSLLVAAPTWADDFSNGNGAGAAANWKVYGINSSANSYSTSAATALPDGIGFAFAAMPDTDTSGTGTGTSLLMTTHPGDLLGDLTGKTITAKFTIEGSPTFTYYGDGETWNSCGTPASVRLYFEGDTKGPFDPAKYWWSNSSSVTLSSAVGQTDALTVTLDPGSWSDWNGQLGSSIPDQFIAAASNVKGIGLSFGGGCFFANGVGLTPDSGAATFQLSSFSVGS